MAQSFISPPQSPLGEGLNRYQLEVAGCEAWLDVESFSGLEQLSETYCYQIRFTSREQDIPREQMLRRSASLSMQSPAEQLFDEFMPPQVHKRVHGVVTDFRRLSASADEATYYIRLEPYFVLLGNQHRSLRFFVNQSVPEIVAQILGEHQLKGWEYEFQLKNSYPRRAQVNQVNESDKAFIERLLAEVGIFYRFVLHPDTLTEIMLFGDRQSCYQFGKTLPLRNPAGMNDGAADSVWGLTVRHKVVPHSVQAKDYNYRLAYHPLLSDPADMTRGDGEGITYGDVYHYLPRHLSQGDSIIPDPETANFWARLEHERYLSAQTRLRGQSNDPQLVPGQVLAVSEAGLYPALPQVFQGEMVITRVRFNASRSSSLQLRFQAMPFSETLCFRPPLKPRPVVHGTLTARVTSPIDNDRYAHLNQDGLYWVKFDADRDDKAAGYESMPLRLARPFGGDTYGFHFPLIQGSEVAVAFHQGDPDRPYISAVLHDSQHPDLVNNRNHTRNVLRTWRNNKLRMEDREGEEHIKLSTEYHKSQLNLGHNVDASRKLRGEGAELRSDGHIAIRGGKGVFISADPQPQAQGEMLDMAGALAQLENALQLVSSLAQSVAISGAETADISSQQQLKTLLSQLEGAGLIASAPAGMAFVTPQNMQISAGKTLTATARGNADWSIFKKFTVAAGEAISLYAHKMGLKFFAARGPISIQAQTDSLALQSKKTMTLNSIEEEIVLNAAQGITLVSKGAYIKIKDGSIEIGAPGALNLKSSNINWGDSGSVETSLSPMIIEDPQYKYPLQGRFQVLDKVTQQPKSFVSYRIEAEDGQIFSGVTDANGYTASHYGIDPQHIKLFYE